MSRLSAAWLNCPESRAVCGALERAGFQALFVGGCVRNALLGVPVSDLDIATDGRPERVMALAAEAGLKAVPTGIEHGTVTVVAAGQSFEVTTFRRDVETDGRHAVVAFSDRVEDDAARRDFTMNALYADSTGQVIDPLGGLGDLRARRLRFIGDPAQRIGEDYLRILRFFRFTAWYGDPALGVDADGLAACAAGLEGLQNVSAERLGHEMRKLLAAPDPGLAVAAMAAAGVLGAVLPGATAEPLPFLVDLERASGHEPEALRRLAVLGGADAAQRLRLSRAEARSLSQMSMLASDAVGAAELAYRHGAPRAWDVVLLRAASTGAPPPPDTAKSIQIGAAAVFPLRAKDLMGAYQGPALGEMLAKLEARWIASEFCMDRAALLAQAT